MSDPGKFLFTPESEAKRPGVVLIQEWWGINEQIQSLGHRWASEGFVTCLPDLFHGELAKSADDAQRLMAKLDWPVALAELAEAVEFVRSHPRCNGKVVVTGYCMGGALAFACAATIPGLAAVVPFYGLPPSANWANVEAPIQAHFAKHDDWATVDGAKKIQHTLEQRGKVMELHVYDAQHAFCNDRRPEVYDPQAAKQAWARAVTFARQHTA